MKGRIWITILAAACLTLTACALRQEVPPPFTPVDISGKAATRFSKKVDNFLVIVDASSSMFELYQGRAKLDRAKSIASNLADTLPAEMQWQGGLRFFGPADSATGNKTALIYGVSRFQKDNFKTALDTIKCGGLTPLALPIDACAEELRNTSGDIAVIIISDGLDNNSQTSPVAAATALKKEFGNRLCLYTIQIGNDPQAAQLLADIATAGQCGYLATEEQVGTPGGMADFVTDVFLKTAFVQPAKVIPVRQDSDKDGVYDDVDKCPGTPIGAKVDANGCPIRLKESVSIDLNVEFAFDRADIQPIYHERIQKVAEFMRAYPETHAVIEGHTDSFGSEAYNMTLSQRRADSVMQYLISRFNIEPARLTAQGFGPTQPVASNETEEGRQKNRRVVATISATPR